MSSAKIIDIRPEDRFRLDDSFVSAYAAQKPDFGPLGEVTYCRTYSRQKPDESYEQWHETIRRVVEGVYTYQKWHCKRLGLPWKDAKAQRSAQEMYGLFFGMKSLPPGRGLWMCGSDYVEQRGSASLVNCSYCTTARIDEDFAGPFTFLMDMSMSGVGVGGDTNGAGKVFIQAPTMGSDVHYVEDTREAWVEVVRRFLDSYVGKADFPICVDYSRIRPAGAPIRGFGGVSSGPAPLMKLIEGIEETLTPLIGKPITSTAIVDLFNKIGVCVVSGNVRRSAEVMLGDADDPEFLSIKDPEKFPDELQGWRWASNNSLIARVGMDYSKAAELTAKNGEPGYFWLDNARTHRRFADKPDDSDSAASGANPCLEVQLESFELCNLGELFPSRHETLDEFKRTIKFAYLYCKTITLVPTHNEHTNAVVMRNRRIGLSMSGIQDAIAKLGRREFLRWCDEGYKYLQRLDQIYSDWLCVPRSKRMTSVKPSGSVSLLPGVSPGIHYPHSKYYFRTIRIAKTSRLLPPLRDAGYRIEQDVCDASSMVVYFPIKEKLFKRSKADVSIWEQVANAAALNRFWADNMVSITVTFKPEEETQIQPVLEAFEDQLKSVSFLPLSDHGYAQAPYQTITEEEYEAAIAELKSVDFDVVEHEVTDSFCDGDRCAVS